VIEKVDGRSFAEAATDRILKPLAAGSLRVLSAGDKLTMWRHSRRPASAQPWSSPEMPDLPLLLSVGLKT
jgi:CubicO group peptidase (beta-lactamase class C family)